MYRAEAEASVRQRLNSLADVDAEADGRLAAILDDVARDTAVRWLGDRDLMLGGDRTDFRSFTRQLSERWGSALDRLEFMVAATEAIGADFVDTQAPTEHDSLFHVLVTLHARACQIGHEVHWVLSGGYPRAAEARSRTLHEIVVAMQVLADHGRNDGGALVERYLDHAIISEARYLESLVTHHAALGVEPPPDEVVQRVRERRQELMTRHGPVFKQSFGWAAAVASDGTIVGAERVAGLGHLRPVYGLHSDSVHAGAHAARSQIVDRGDGRFRHTNATMFGLGLAGVMTARLLVHAAGSVVGSATVAPDVGFVVCAAALRTIATAVEVEFVSAGDALQGH